MGNLDKPLDKTLDKMVDYLLACDEIAFLDLVQLVWRRGWALASAAMLEDEDVLRRALKASIIERMVEILSTPPKNNAEEVPYWCNEVSAVAQRYYVLKLGDSSIWEDEPSCPAFEIRNIFAPKQFMFFL